jgi:capsular polysaccharide biosynthesis protein
MGQHAASGQDLTKGQWLRLALVAMVITVLGGVVGLVGSYLLPEEYAARAELHYNLAQAKPNELLREDRTLNTQLVVIRSRTLLGPVASANGLTAEELGGKVTVMVVESSEIIQVEVRDSSGARAQRLLEQITTGYLAVANRGEEVLDREAVESQLRAVRESLSRPDLSTEQAEVLALREASLIGQLDSIELAEQATAEVLTAPYTVPGQVSPRPRFAAATGALTALLLAAAVVALLARRWMRGGRATDPARLTPSTAVTGRGPRRVRSSSVATAGSVDRSASL